ncbi:hypothetical protein BX070DRAFT_254148 [Coemansia spiralis]|nr:hypothetical protein BX070DRAFT_254148 [Coemansia spiralis]
MFGYGPGAFGVQFAVSSIPFTLPRKNSSRASAPKATTPVRQSSRLQEKQRTEFASQQQQCPSASISESSRLKDAEISDKTSPSHTETAPGGSSELAQNIRATLVETPTKKRHRKAIIAEASQKRRRSLEIADHKTAVSLGTAGVRRSPRNAARSRNTYNQQQPSIMDNNSKSPSQRHKGTDTTGSIWNLKPTTATRNNKHQISRQPEESRSKKNPDDCVAQADATNSGSVGPSKGPNFRSSEADYDTNTAKAGETSIYSYQTSNESRHFDATSEPIGVDSSIKAEEPGQTFIDSRNNSQIASYESKSNESHASNRESESDDQASTDGIDDELRIPQSFNPNISLSSLASIFGSQINGHLSMFGAALESMANPGSTIQFRQLLVALRQGGNPAEQFVALQELVELLAMATEDTLIGVNITELSITLIGLLKGSSGGDSFDESFSFATGNPDAMLLACRCLSNLLEAFPMSGSIMCRHGAIEVLCSKLREIEYIDLAEQALSTLRCLSKDYPDKICEVGGMSACLLFLDFFATSVQQNALICAMNCARVVTRAQILQAKDTAQVLERTISSSDQNIASLSCSTMLHIVNAFRSYPEHIEELVSEIMLKSIIEGAYGEATSVAATVRTSYLRIMTVVIRSSNKRAIQALDGGIIPALKSILSHDFKLSDTATDTPQKHAGSSSSSISDQTWCALHLMSVLLPKLPLDQRSLEQVEEIIVSRNLEIYQDRLEGTSDDQLRRMSAIVSRSAIMEQLQELFIPLAIRILAATTDVVAQYRLLQTILKVVFISDADSLRATLDNVSIPLFIANAISTMDSPILSGITLLIMRIVLEKLSGVYEEGFVREGIADALKNLVSTVDVLVSQRVYLDETKPTSSENDIASEAGDNDSEAFTETLQPDEDPHCLVYGFKMVNTHISTTSRSSLTSEFQRFSLISEKMHVALPKKLRTMLEWILIQAQALHALLKETSSAESLDDDNTTLSKLKRISQQLNIANPSHEAIALCLTELASYLASESSITCHELICSGIVDSLLHCLRLTKTKVADGKISESAMDDILLCLFGHAQQAESPVIPFSPVFTLLIQRLQETLNLTERLYIQDVYKSPSDEVRPPIHMLTKHIRLLISPASSRSLEKSICTVETGCSTAEASAAMARIQRSFQPITLGIHAVATFGALEAYLRPRIALCIRTKDKSSGAQRKALATEEVPSFPFLRDSGSIHGNRPRESQLERLTSNPSSDDNSDMDSFPASQANRPKQEHLRMLQMIAQSSGIDLRAVGLFDSLDDTHDSDSDSQASDSNGSSSEQSSEEIGDVEYNNSDSFDQSDDQDASELHIFDDMTRPSTSIEPEQKPEWRLVFVLKVGNTERHVDASDNIFRMLHEMCQREVGHNETNIWSTTFTLNFHVEFLRSTSNETLQHHERHHYYKQQQQGQQQDQQLNEKQISNNLFENRMDSAYELASSIGVESSTIVELIGLLYNMLNQTRSRILSHLLSSNVTITHQISNLLAAYGHSESSDTIDRLFVNSKLNSKVSRQLNIPLVVVCSALPDWCHSLVKYAPFLLSFETRLTYLRTTGFGYARTISYWQGIARREAVEQNGRTSSETQVPLGRIQRQKVRISRQHMLESALKVLEMYGNSKTVLEIEYFDEAGIGNGPTLEFYSSVSHCLQERALGIWRDENSIGGPAQYKKETNDASGSASSSAPFRYVDASSGLFPSAIDPTNATNSFVDSKGSRFVSDVSDRQQQDKGDDSVTMLSTDRTTQLFRFIGHFVAKGLMDSRILDIPLNEEFWAAVQRYSLSAVADGHDVCFTWTWVQLERVDKRLATSLRYLQRFVDAKNAIYARTDLTVEQKQREILGIHDAENQANIEDLALDFTLPGNPTIELRPGGSEIPVTISNIHTYIDLVARWTLYTGIITQVAAFCEGFNRIFPISNLAIFTPSDLCRIFGPSKDSEDWTMSTLTSNIKIGNGYSPTLLERRAFLQFVTGSPRLPIGGFQALNPPMMVVLKSNEPPLVPDDYLPSVMTCGNTIKMPAYSSFKVLQERWSQAISEGCDSFHLS